MFANIVICSSWFLLTSLWWKRLPATRREEIESFNDRMRRPITDTEITGTATDYHQAHMMGRVAIGFGAFVLLLALIPNPMLGRLAFLFCGGCVLGIGVLLRRSGHHAQSLAESSS